MRYHAPLGLKEGVFGNSQGFALCCLSRPFGAIRVSKKGLERDFGRFSFVLHLRRLKSCDSGDVTS